MFDGSDSESDTEIQVRPEACGVMSFHNGTEISMFIYIENLLRIQCPTDPDELVDAVLAHTDTFCIHRHWMMHVGPSKAKYLREATKQVQESHDKKPLRFLELGSYCGYSSIILARELRRLDAQQGRTGSRLKKRAKNG